MTPYFKEQLGLPVLWCIHIPGPCEVYAAPSKYVAEFMSAKHNDAMSDYFRTHADRSKHAPSLDACLAAVRPWPFDHESHSAEVAVFDYASWGLTKP